MTGHKCYAIPASHHCRDAICDKKKRGTAFL